MSDVYEPDEAPMRCPECAMVPVERYGGTRMEYPDAKRCSRCGSNLPHPHGLDAHDCTAALALRVAKLEHAVRNARVSFS